MMVLFQQVEVEATSEPSFWEKLKGKLG